MSVASISDLAEILAENLGDRLRDRKLEPTELDRMARLPAGFTQRCLDNDPTAYPCPRQMGRITNALDTTSAELLTF